MLSQGRRCIRRTGAAWRSGGGCADGRTRSRQQPFKTWLEQRDQAWREPRRGGHERCRRRVQQELHGHRGRAQEWRPLPVHCRSGGSDQRIRKARQRPAGSRNCCDPGPGDCSDVTKEEVPLGVAASLRIGRIFAWLLGGPVLGRDRLRKCPVPLRDVTFVGVILRRACRRAACRCAHHLTPSLRECARRASPARVIRPRGARPGPPAVRPGEHADVRSPQRHRRGAAAESNRWQPGLRRSRSCPGHSADATVSLPRVCIYRSQPEVQARS